MELGKSEESSWMNGAHKFNFESPAVHSYLNILQSVINRMATNSAACKTWCVALVSAVVVVLAKESKSEFVWISLIPVTLFLFLDSYYLSLEKRFRGHYDEFIKRLHLGETELEDLFIVKPEQGFKVFCRSLLCSIASFSVWPFYLLFISMLMAIPYLLNT